ncbi:hypothetical protein [Sphingomonas sp.]|uniref:hypothetical protein n=1 Tax=Sphingomonas sp. TaxID=28214 RepID=UPI003AFFE854
MERTTDRKAYRVSGSATYSKGLDGWYAPKLTLMDELGCTTEVSLPDTQIADERSSGFVTATYDQQIQLPHPVARASLHVDYGEAKRFNDPTSVVDTPVYDQEQVVDASVRPPSEPAAGCAARAKAARRREGKAADTGDGLDRLPRNRLVALAINSAGFLCARVTDLYPDSAGQIIAHCVKYRTGRGRDVSHRRGRRDGGGGGLGPQPMSGSVRRMERRCVPPPRLNASVHLPRLARPCNRIPYRLT